MLDQDLIKTERTKTIKLRQLAKHGKLFCPIPGREHLTELGSRGKGAGRGGGVLIF